MRLCWHILFWSGSETRRRRTKYVYCSAFAPFFPIGENVEQLERVQMEQLASPYPQSKIMQRDKETGEEKEKKKN